MNKKAQQQGVVLLSCLVFLLLILMLVRFSLYASRFEQEKVAVDVNDTIAYQFANIALRDAERQIAGVDPNGVFCGNPDAPPTCDKANIPKQATVLSQTARQRLALETLRNEAKSGDPGVVDGTAQKACGAPLWQCVAWNSAYYHGERSANQSIQPATYGRYSGANLSGASMVAAPPQYVIEVINGSDYGKPNTTMVRVTAVGYGRPGAAERVSNAMVQATYYFDF